MSILPSLLDDPLPGERLCLAFTLSAEKAAGLLWLVGLFLLLASKVFLFVLYVCQFHYISTWLVPPFRSPLKCHLFRKTFLNPYLK